MLFIVKRTVQGAKTYLSELTCRRGVLTTIWTAKVGEAVRFQEVVAVDIALCIQDELNVTGTINAEGDGKP